jgi:hypothetical protein
MPLSLAVPASAYPPPSAISFGSYSHNWNLSPCAARVDPVTMIFWSNGTSGNVTNFLKTRGPYRDRVSANQRYATSGICRGPQQGDVYFVYDPGASLEDHIRVFQHPSQSGSGWNWWSLGTPHREKGCGGGHRVIGGTWSNGTPTGEANGFVVARDYATAILEANGYLVEYAFLGNAQVMVQACSSSRVGNDGWVRYVRFP